MPPYCPIRPPNWFDDFDDDDDFDPPFAHAVEGEPPDEDEPNAQGISEAGWRIVEASLEADEPDFDPDDTQPVDLSKLGKKD